MRIDGYNPIEEKRLNNNVHELDKNKNIDKKDESQKTESDRDRVSLSGKAKEINELKGIINDLPDVRLDRVDAIKSAVDSGSYNFDASRIAQKIMEEEI